MNTNSITHSTIIALAAGIACSSVALANDTTSDTSALERLEAARSAFIAAQAELEAAQAQYEAQTGTHVEIATDSSTETATSHIQPAAEPETPADPSSWKDGWDWSVDIGISGASGNNENFSGRAALGGQRNTSKYETSLKLSYIYGTSDGQANTSRGEIRLHNDWLTDGKWRYFADAGYEYDEFQAWQHRFSAAGGLGYEFINDDKQKLIGRAGLGASYETGKQADEKLIPEGLLGLDWEYKLSQNTTLTASTTYYPSFDDFGEFRWNNNAGISVVLDEETGMTMNAGLEHRHDSDPGSGIKPNDINYYMGVGWSF
ncbi:MAG: DUF481 domain-containing protein [Phycisphaerales bacterium]